MGLEDILKIVEIAGGVLFAAFAAGAIISIAVTYFDKDTARNELKNRNISKAVVKGITTSDSVTHIKLDALTEDDKEVEVDIGSEN